MYSLKSAAEATGRGKPAILKAIQKGRISARKNELGEWQIDPAELHRVYPPVSRKLDDGTGGERQETTLEITRLAVDVAVKDEKIVSLEAQLERERELNQELSRRLDEEAAERRKAADEIRRLTLMLTDQRQPTPDPIPFPTANEGKGRLWEKLFGRK